MKRAIPNLRGAVLLEERQKVVSAVMEAAYGPAREAFMRPTVFADLIDRVILPPGVERPAGRVIKIRLPT